MSLQQSSNRAFSMIDLLVAMAVLALLAAVISPLAARARAKTRQAACEANLGQVSRAILLYADEHQKTLPILPASSQKAGWWWYKEQVKSYAGLKGKSSADDKVFACPSDRGYDEGAPFCRSAKFDYGSYCFNGVNLAGIPNIAGRRLESIRDPRLTLLVMEWAAHAPLSWHKSKTGSANAPFYNDAQSLTAFVDGHVSLTPIYYDGMNAAYTRDPVPGYSYKYSAD